MHKLVAWRTNGILILYAARLSLSPLLNQSIKVYADKNNLQSYLSYFITF